MDFSKTNLTSNVEWTQSVFTYCSCWHKDPPRRPPFIKIVVMLEHLMQVGGCLLRLPLTLKRNSIDP